jgi:hypothetical protein
VDEMQIDEEEIVADRVGVPDLLGHRPHTRLVNASMPER